MSDTISCDSWPHIAFIPCAGIGHLTPFFQLAAMLASRNCIVTVFTAQPTLSAAESAHIDSFFATHPHIRRRDFHITSSRNSSTKDDPFFIQYDAINRSVHLLSSALSSSSPPFSAIVSDFVMATNISRIADDLCIPNYILITTSARFLTLMACYPFLTSTQAFAEFSTSRGIPLSSIPPPLFHPDTTSLFISLLASNAPSFTKAKGVLLNTFHSFETEMITAFNNGKVSPNFPPVLPIGPFEPHRLDQDHHLPWLDDQPAESVIYICFGSRTAMPKDQIRELGKGLEGSGHAFLWVLKGSKVDKDDKQDVEELVGDSFLKNTKNKGMVVKGWVNQKQILEHAAIGGFVSHCGWNSVIEAAGRGVPMLAWPQYGDQKINAEVVDKARLGVWPREWGWGAEKLVKGEEIQEKIMEVMGDYSFRAKAKKIGQQAMEAIRQGGSSDKVLTEVIESLKPKEGK